MAQVTVTIAGRSYRMACSDGDEARLEGLAAMFDGRIEELRRSFGEIGDMRLHVMAALTQADELNELKRRLGDLESETAILRAKVDAADGERTAVEARMAEGLGRAAERIERLANGLSAG
jgi:cell division protein ZapA